MVLLIRKRAYLKVFTIYIKSNSSLSFFWPFKALLYFLAVIDPDFGLQHKQQLQNLPQQLRKLKQEILYQ
jgi:hypothetical protein